MGVISCNELWPGRQGTVDFLRRRQYTRIFEVYTNSTLNEAFIVSTVSGFGLPIRGQSYPFDVFARCIEITPEQDEADPLRWIVTCKYDSHPDLHLTQPDGSSTDPASLPDNPLLQPPEFKFYFQQYEQVVRRSYKFDITTGLNFSNTSATISSFNSTGVPFDPPITAERSRMCMTITGNVANVDLSALPKLIDAVNTKTWKGVAPLCARCTGVEATTQFQNNISFWRLSYNISLKWDTWLLPILDCGYEIIQSAGTPNQRLAKIILPGGREPTSPIPLNGSGQLLPLGDDPVFEIFSVYQQVDFNAMVPW